MICSTNILNDFISNKTEHSFCNTNKRLDLLHKQLFVNWVSSIIKVYCESECNEATIITMCKTKCEWHRLQNNHPHKLL